MSRTGAATATAVRITLISQACVCATTAAAAAAAVAATATATATAVESRLVRAIPSSARCGVATSGARVSVIKIVAKRASGTPVCCGRTAATTTPVARARPPDARSA